MSILKVKKLNDKAILPKYGTEASAGADLYALIEEGSYEIQPGETKIVHTGIAIEIPDGYVGLIYARSGLATKKGLAPANKVGVIDSDYRGEIMVALYNHSENAQVIDNQERVAQLVIAPYLKMDIEEVQDLSDSERGQGGFGSTGRK